MSNLQEENIPLPQQDMGAVIILARPNAATKRQYSGNSATGVHAVIPGCVSKEAISQVSSFRAARSGDPESRNCSAGFPNAHLRIQYIEIPGSMLCIAPE
jgi:hypothetical protein